MGKTRVIQKTEEEILKEKEAIDQTLKQQGGKVSVKKSIPEGKIFINSTYNNTILTVTDRTGNVLAWASAGSVGFKGSKKSTPFAASKVAEVIAEKIRNIGIGELSIFVRGIGSGRESAIRSLGNRGVNVVSIKDVTSVPHNGCRPPKIRRV